jgi:hypothetical protein
LADEDNAGLLQRARKGFALGQEAVAGMHRLRARLAAGVDDLVHDEIALGRCRRADENSFVRHLHVQCVAVGFGVDGYRCDAHAAGGLDDPAGDLAAVCDQDFLEHAL